MFWTDWSTNNPRVTSAFMDGTNASVIVNGSARVHWPNGLAIDEQLDRLYITDAFLDRIVYCDLTGAGFTVLLQQSALIQHPYAIGVFKASIVHWYASKFPCLGLNIPVAPLCVDVTMCGLILPQY